jgi:hypothetical protein
LRVEQNLLSSLYNIKHRSFARCRPINANAQIDLLCARVVPVFRDQAKNGICRRGLQ